MPGTNSMRIRTYLDYSEAVFMRRDLSKFEKYILLFVAQRCFKENLNYIHIPKVEFMAALDFTAAGYIKHMHKLRDRGFISQIRNEYGCIYQIVLPLPFESQG